jgi:hypothetical protein
MVKFDEIISLHWNPCTVNTISVYRSYLAMELAYNPIKDEIVQNLYIFSQLINDSTFIKNLASNIAPKSK